MKNKKQPKRDQWASSLGFILAASGSAIGLGNLWKFPYLAGMNGGFAFIIIYLVFVVAMGIPFTIIEMAVGRMTQKNPYGAYKKLDKRFAFVGALGVLTAFLILSYYSIVGGWVSKYAFSYITTAAAPASFGTFIGLPFEPLVWNAIFMGITVAICYGGSKGIEKASKILMPMLFFFLLVVIIRSVTLPGAQKGLAFLFSPNTGENGFKFSTSVPAALGQVFFSLSLGMGIMVTYGSYLNKKSNIQVDSVKVAFLDVLAAILAGIAIMPAVFAVGMQPGQGPGLIFETLPAVFLQMPFGNIIAIIFFLLVLFAAATSSVSILECVISFTMDEFKWTRKKSVLTIGFVLFCLGIPSSLSQGPLGQSLILFGMPFFDFMSFLTDNILLPACGLFTCIFIGWFFGSDKIIAQAQNEGTLKFKFAKTFSLLIKFVMPVLVVIVILAKFGVLDKIIG